MVIGRLSDLMVFNLLAGGTDVIHRGRKRGRERQREREQEAKGKIRLTIIIPRFNEPYFAVCVRLSLCGVLACACVVCWPLLFLSVSAFSFQLSTQYSTVQ